MKTKKQIKDAAKDQSQGQGITIVLDRDIYNRLAKLSENSGRTKVFYIRMLLSNYIDELEKTCQLPVMLSNSKN
jgi:predicted DNA-binding protein